jgi:hypothetical protein
MAAARTLTSGQACRLEGAKPTSLAKARTASPTDSTERAVTCCKSLTSAVESQHPHRRLRGIHRQTGEQDPHHRFVWGSAVALAFEIKTAELCCHQQRQALQWRLRRLVGGCRYRNGPRAYLQSAESFARCIRGYWGVENTELEVGLKH